MIPLGNCSDPSCSSSDQFIIKEADPVVNFSIRNHVFASRNKTFGCSWPFSSHLLQLCLKHDVRDLLPPFESSDCVRASCSSKPIPAASLSDIRGIILVDQDQPDLVNDARQVETVLNYSMLIQKPGAVSETSTACTGSDIMASIVCPVCKSFSSTSNTTLNAHMDQCLSMESVDKLPKLKAKPKKKRLMEDIYATARSCTLEELDRRNGSTWATFLNAAVLRADTRSDCKRTNGLRSEGEDGESEGKVYVDSNGIKLRILSKLSDAPTKEEYNARKNMNNVRDGKAVFYKNSAHFSNACSKKMKTRLRNKKLSSMQFFKNQSQAGRDEDYSQVEDDGSLIQVSGETGLNFNFGSAALKSWPSSKRSDLLKKVGKKDLHKIMENNQYGNQLEMVETRRLETDSISSARSHFGKLSQLLQPKMVDLPFISLKNTHSHERRSHDWSPEGISSIDQNCHISHKTKRISTLSGLHPSSIKLNKQRSLFKWTDRMTRRHIEEEDSNHSLPQGSNQCSDIISKTRAVQNVVLNTLKNDVESQDNQSPSKDAFSAKDVIIDIPRGNCAIFPFDDGSLVPNQENKVTSFRDQSVSPASSGSTISPSSPKQYHFKDSASSPSEPKLNFPSPLISVSNETQGMIVDRNQPLEMDLDRCCCSCQNLIAAKKKPLPNLHFIPSISSFYSNSNMDSPTDSILTRTYSDVSTAGASCGTPTQSSSNSILRLMGKDLMVVHNEPQTHHSVTKAPPLPLSFPSYSTAFPFAVSNLSPSIITSQSYNCLPCFHPRSVNQKSYTSKEVIQMEDSNALLHASASHSTMFQQPFGYLPPYIDTTNHPISQGNPFPPLHFPRPFAFPSPSATQMNSWFYYPHTLR